MASEIFLKSYDGFEVNTEEVKRYALCKGTDSGDPAQTLLDECIEEATQPGVISYKISYRILSIVSMDEANGEIDLELTDIKSDKLIINLKGCSYVVFLAATLGMGIDRLIHKYSLIYPAKALFMQAIGAERIETMLDAFMEDLPGILEEYLDEKVSIRPRFSPGFGDLSLQIQPEFLNIVNAQKRLGITLNDSLLMSPSKSVTAIVGVRT